MLIINDLTVLVVSVVGYPAVHSHLINFSSWYYYLEINSPVKAPFHVADSDLQATSFELEIKTTL